MLIIFTLKKYLKTGRHTFEKRDAYNYIFLNLKCDNVFSSSNRIHEIVTIISTTDKIFILSLNIFPQGFAM